MLTVVSRLPDPLPEFFDCGCPDVYYCPVRSSALGTAASMSAATHLIGTSRFVGDHAREWPDNQSRDLGGS